MPTRPLIDQVGKRESDGARSLVHQQRRRNHRASARTFHRGLLTLLVVAALLPLPAVASSHKSCRIHSRSKEVYVHGYTTKSGRHVSGYYRSRPKNIGTGPGASTRQARRHGKRSKAAIDKFKREHPCPSTGRRSGPCHGYVIDHKKPLACGGADNPSNMQW